MPTPDLPQPIAWDAVDRASLMFDRFGRPANLENAYLGGHVFLVLGGPSRKLLDQELFRVPGVVTFAVNNVAADLVRSGIPPNFWTYGDSTEKFHDAIWHCPNVIKIIPYPKADNLIYHQYDDGRIAPSSWCPRRVPGVFGIARNTTLIPDQWLWEPSVNWGHGIESILLRVREYLEKEHGLPANAKRKDAEKFLEAVLADGRYPMDLFRKMRLWPKVLSTMLQGVRLCYYLGFRHVYLVGCDFTMSDGYRYSFDELPKHSTIGGNNNAYLSLSEIFRDLRTVFDANGFEVLNVNPESYLTVFDYLPFETAVCRACANMPRVIDTRGWYNK